MVTGRGYFPVGERGASVAPRNSTCGPLVKARIAKATMSRKTMRVRLDQMHSTFDICVDAKADQSARRGTPAGLISAMEITDDATTIAS